VNNSLLLSPQWLDVLVVTTNKWYYPAATIFLHSSAMDCYLISTNNQPKCH